MFSLSQLFVTAAFAQDATAAAPPPSLTNGLMNYLPFIAIFAVFYFIVIRPQQQKLNDQAKMIKALQRGDRVVTNGGMHGKIVRLEGDDHLIIEIADGVQIKHERSQIQGVATKPQPVVAAVEEEKK